MIIREFKQLFLSGRRSKGVTIFAFLFIMSSFIHINKFIVDLQWYADTYSYMPPWLMLTRYTFSRFQRVLGVLAAVGILALNEAARKLLIAIEVFTILTINWKHPYEGYKAHTDFLDGYLGPMLHQLGTPAGFKISAYALPAAIVNRVLDVIFCLIVIYFFTRPSVKKQFDPSL